MFFFLLFNPVLTDCQEPMVGEANCNPRKEYRLKMSPVPAEVDLILGHNVTVL